MANPDQSFGWAVSTSRLNKRILSNEKGSWQNKQGNAEAFFADLKDGKAVAPVLCLNITHTEQYQAQTGRLPDPSKGSFRRTPINESERNNNNIAEISIQGFDLDDDASLELIQQSPFLKEMAMGFYTTSSHGIGEKGTRARVVFVTEYPIALDYDSDDYSAYNWRTLAVRTELFAHLGKDLGIEELIDPSGNDPARIWYGNTGPSHPIGSDDYPDTPAGESIQVIYGNVVPWSFVTEAWRKWEEHYLLSPEEKARRAELQQKRESGELGGTTTKQIKVAHYLLTSGVLSASRSTDRHEWFKVACACKRLDPEGAVLMPAFLVFSEQSKGDNVISESELSDFWNNQLPPQPQAGITSLKTAADEDTPGWQSYCPFIGYGLTAQATQPFNGTGIMGPMKKMLADLKAGKYRKVDTRPELNGHKSDEYNGYDQQNMIKSQSINDDF